MWTGESPVLPISRVRVGVAEVSGVVTQGRQHRAAVLQAHRCKYLSLFIIALLIMTTRICLSSDVMCGQDFYQ